MAHNVLENSSTSEPLLEIALKLEEIALKEEYFIEKKLYPNVDFYSGLIYKALNFPVNMFPVMFAMGRLPGWIAQWKELQEDDDFRIGRPRQIYIGTQTKDYVPIENRLYALNWLYSASKAKLFQSSRRVHLLHFKLSLL